MKTLNNKVYKRINMNEVSEIMAQGNIGTVDDFSFLFWTEFVEDLNDVKFKDVKTEIIDNELKTTATIYSENFFKN